MFTNDLKNGLQSIGFATSPDGLKICGDLTFVNRKRKKNF